MPSTVFRKEYLSNVCLIGTFQVNFNTDINKLTLTKVQYLRIKKLDVIKNIKNSYLMVLIVFYQI